MKKSNEYKGIMQAIILVLLFILFLVIGILVEYKKLPKRIETDSNEVRQEFVIENNTDEYVLWPEVEEVDAKYSFKFMDRTKFYDKGLNDEDVSRIEKSLSKYCEQNSIEISGVSLTSVVEDDKGLYRTFIKIDCLQLEQIYDAKTNMQRVNYIVGDSIMNKFGVLYENLSQEEQLRCFRVLSEYSENFSEIYSVKEYNCCYVYFYIDSIDDSKRYVKVYKNSDKNEEYGFWDETGIIEKS